MRKILSIALSVCMLLSTLVVFPMQASASGKYEQDNLTWDYDSASHTLYITGEGSMTYYSMCYAIGGFNSTDCYNVVIGDGITDICEYAFSGWENLTTLILGKDIKSIGYYAFENCRSLESVKLPDAAVNLGSYCFSGCTSLKSINLENVTEFGVSVFEGCSSLDDIALNESLTAIPESLFNRCSSLTEITVPDSVEIIGGNAFHECSDLKNIHFGKSVKSIGSYAFYYCKRLSSVVLPDSVETIESYAFQHDRHLTSVTLGKSVSSIDYCAFDGCSTLVEIINNSSLEDDSLGLNDVYIHKGESVIRNIDGYLFCYIDGEDNLIGYTGDDTVLSLPERDMLSPYRIGKSAFEEDNRITGVNIPPCVTAIDVAAFCECSALKEIYTGDNVTSIGTSAFQFCPALQKVVIGNKVTEIGWYAFNGDTNLLSLTMGASVETIGYQAFGGDSKIVDVIDLYYGEKRVVYVPDGDHNLDYLAYAFGYDAKHRVSVRTKDSLSFEPLVTEKDGFLFATVNGVNCLVGYEKEYYTENTSIVLPPDYNGEGYEISNFAFQDNPYSDLVFYIPSTVTRIAPYALGSNVVIIYYSGTEEMWENITEDFYGCYIESIYYNSISPCTTHAFETVTTPAACCTDGITVRTCKVCGVTQQEKYSRLGHVMETAAVAGTSTTRSCDSHFCTREGCGFVYQDNFGDYGTAKPGDLNGDGKITAADVVLLKKIIVGKVVNSDYADVNGDGKVTASDVVLLKKIIVGKA